jgi:hypothetical protein
MAVRSALHRAGAAALSQLLQFPAPSDGPRTVACPCGQQAPYHQLRTKPLLTAVGWAEVSRPYYWCPACHAGQYPADVELDIEGTEVSPGVRRMQALVGQAAPFSTTYTGAVETAEEFGRRLYQEAGKRGWSRAQKKVVMGDGAEWIGNLVAEHFPGAMQIVDLYHARQHLWDLARRLYANDEGKRKAWIKLHQKRLLDRGKIEKLVGALRALKSRNSEVTEKIHIEADYFERNAERMRYPRFRRQHLFVGSGVIEAGCKTVVASRLKRSGMFWTVRGANAILALRCAYLNGRFEDYWESRRAAIAA